jgi:NADH-quinone oxidoreductase subunit E
METQTGYSVTDPLLDGIIEKHKGEPGMLLTTLEEAQKMHPWKYLPGETLAAIARKLRIPPTTVYSVASFYSFFNLEPQGKHTIVVCRGTACHTRGSKALLDEIPSMLGISREENDAGSSFTTPDKRFTIRTVACFGQCAQSPVVEVDGVMHSNVNSRKLMSLLSSVLESETEKNEQR